MKELKCPHCQKTFSVDESDYADLLNQVRNESFDEELCRRVAEMRKTQEAVQQAAMAEAQRQNDHQQALKDSQIARLSQELKSAREQVQGNVDLAVAKKEQELLRQFAEKERLMADSIAKEREKVQALQSRLNESDTDKRLALMEAEKRSIEDLHRKDEEIQGLKNKVLVDAQMAREREANLNEQHRKELDRKDEVIAQYKDFKVRLSTKMIGESLEVYCNNQFETLVHPYLPTAQFGKDNDVVEGTKGDFVFRDVVDGTESVSIMFEMKNEADETATKHKNADFFDKLDKDRKKKKCEYAVLVTLLELDNDLYNNGIYAVPGYEKMYVVRPQQFLTIISLLVQMGRNTLQMKKELIEARNKEVDVTNFENKITAFKENFERHYDFASKKFEAAIADIDATIKKLEAVKAELTSSQNYLRMADQDTANLTIRKLTYNNPTMKAKFEEARNNEED